MPRPYRRVVALGYGAKAHGACLPRIFVDLRAWRGPFEGIADAGRLAEATAGPTAHDMSL